MFFQPATLLWGVSILRRDQLDVDVDLNESQYQLNFHIYPLEQCRCQQHIRGLKFDKPVWILDVDTIFDELELEPFDSSTITVQQFTLVACVASIQQQPNGQLDIEQFSAVTDFCLLACVVSVQQQPDSQLDIEQFSAVTDLCLLAIDSIYLRTLYSGVSIQRFHTSNCVEYNQHLRHGLDLLLVLARDEHFVNALGLRFELFKVVRHRSELLWGLTFGSSHREFYGNHLFHIAKWLYASRPELDILCW
ncbi:hypothetical protein B0A54_10754 [Friedmanniomyces endolithicus]|uniref:Uncharacterized protein n=1 Tax=Friedmanniomyces endolithicus TaxID=329885 RepID=A0A4U0URS5_9PEZI|nr:hypothetical protein B0A54_10754 [Friedmanniomyces endolithicus]